MAGLSLPGLAVLLKDRARDGKISGSVPLVRSSRRKGQTGERVRNPMRIEPVEFVGADGFSAFSVNLFTVRSGFWPLPPIVQRTHNGWGTVDSGR